MLSASGRYRNEQPGNCMIEKIETKDAPQPIGPYSQAIRANGFVFVSGQIAIDPKTGAMVEGDASVQARRVMMNIAAILEAAGSGMGKIVRTTIYLKDLNDFSEVNRIYGEFLGDLKPARATVEVARLPKDGLIEVDVVALA